MVNNMKVEENNTRRNLLISLSTLLLIVVVVGITYAFFRPSETNTAVTNVNINAFDQAVITFTGGSDLSMNAYQPGVSRELYFDVKLQSTGGDMSASYDIIWQITNNTFKHDETIGNENDAELLYSLYISQDQSTWTAEFENKDATALTGDVKLATNHLVIASNGSTARNYYKFVVTYPSLNKDQSFNMESTLNSNIKIVPSV